MKGLRNMRRRRVHEIRRSNGFLVLGQAGNAEPGIETVQ